MKKNKPITLSVLITTYNQQDYIERCVTSILNQNCLFRYEILIWEDRSTDNTFNIIKDIRDKNRGTIFIIQPDNNEGDIIGLKKLCKIASGKYIAFCEGDDFWHDERKLQKQVDFLEANPDYGLVHSDVNHFYEHSGKLIKNYNKSLGFTIPEGDIFNDLIDSSKNHGHILKTMTVIVRRDILNEYYDHNVAIKKKWKLTDLAMWLDISRHSKIHYIDKSLATYCLRGESVSRTKNPAKKLQFHQSVYDIRKYYMEKYDCSQELREKLEISHNKTLIADAYFANEKELCETAYRYLKDHNVKLTSKEKLLYLGSKSTFVRRLVDVGRKMR